jgi:tetratricopeptide (TPR) repeat protein
MKAGIVAANHFLRAALLGAVVFALPFCGPGFAQQPKEPAKRRPVAVATPFEVSTSPAGNYLSALIAGADRDTHAAATFAREALRFDRRNKELIERAFVASLSNGDMREAFGIGERLAKLDPKNGLVNLAMGARSFKNRQFANARTEISRGGVGRQRDLTVTLLTAWSYAGAGDSRRALDTLDKIRDERLASFRDYHMGLIADIAGNTAEATKRLKAAYEAEKTSLRILDSWARFQSRRGERDDAKKAYEAYDQIAPRHPLVLAAMADLASGKALESNVPNAVAGAGEVFYQLGAMGSQQNDSFAAMIYLRMALHLAPENALGVITLADIYERLKQYERAIDVYEMVPAKSPLRNNADVQSALILEAMGKSDDALKHMKSIVAAAPKDIEALTSLANLHRARKEFKEAAEAYTKVIETIEKPSRGDWTMFYFRGIAFERSKQWPKAEADFKKALELFPDQPMVLNYLGYSWVDQGINLEEGFRLLREAVRQRPNDGYIIDSLGWAHYRLGRYEEALKELEKAIELKPGDPVINDHLGDVYWKVGRKLEAKFQWNHARDLKPEPDDLEKILKKIEHGMDDEPKPAAAEAEAPRNGG